MLTNKLILTKRAAVRGMCTAALIMFVRGMHLDAVIVLQPYETKKFLRDCRNIFLFHMLNDESRLSLERSENQKYSFTRATNDERLRYII